MAARYRYMIVDATDGLPVAEMPFINVRFDDKLNAFGTFTGTIPLEHPQSNFLQTGKYEIAVLRNDVECVWNGPIVRSTSSLRSRTIQVTAYTTWWYFSKRIINGSRNYRNAAQQGTRDIFFMVRDVVALATTGLPGGTIPNFTISQANSGKIKPFSFSVADARTATDIIDDLAYDPTDGFDYRIRWTVQPGIPKINKFMDFARPNFTRDITSRPLEPGNGLLDLNLDEDIERAANRVYVLGGGSGGSTRKRAIANSGASLNAGYPHLAEAVNRNDVESQAALNGIANQYRQALFPPVRGYTATYRPTLALPFGFCDLGDKVRIKVPTGYFSNTPTDRRVIGIATEVDEQGEEIITLSLDNPADINTA